MKILKDGTVEGTPEELAAYELAKQRLLDIGKPTVPAPLPLPDPWPHIPFDPQIGDPPNSLRYAIPMSAPHLCDTCAAKVARGEMAVCGCVLSGPQVMG